MGPRGQKSHAPPEMKNPPRPTTQFHNTLGRLYPSGIIGTPAPPLLRCCRQQCGPVVLFGCCLFWSCLLTSVGHPFPKTWGLRWGPAAATCCHALLLPRSLLLLDSFRISTMAQK